MLKRASSLQLFLSQIFYIFFPLCGLSLHRHVNLLWVFKSGVLDYGQLWAENLLHPLTPGAENSWMVKNSLDNGGKLFRVQRHLGLFVTRTEHTCCVLWHVMLHVSTSGSLKIWVFELQQVFIAYLFSSSLSREEKVTFDLFGRQGGK